MRVQEGLEREGLYMYLQLIHGILQQKLTQHCKAVILQLKKKKNRKTKTKKAAGRRAHSETLYQASPFAPLLPAAPTPHHAPQHGLASSPPCQHLLL